MFAGVNDKLEVKLGRFADTSPALSASSNQKTLNLTMTLPDC
jgi:hypothetical protein